MSEENCIFCKIAAGTIPANKVYEDDLAVAFHDITPQAPNHVLIIPREHLESLNDAGKGDQALLGHLLWLAPKIANQLGIAIARRSYRAHRELLVSLRWRKLAEAGAREQRLLWASTGTKDPAAAETLYLEALAAPDTINTIPEKTLLAFAEHGVVNGSMPADGGDAEKVLAAFAQAGVDEAALATQLQHEGVEAFSKSWSDLMAIIASKSATLVKNQSGGSAHS